MQNLAGHDRATEIISDELQRCGIDIKPSDKLLGEAKSMVFGELNGFKFERAWYYYMVNGQMPIDKALDLYNDPVGKTDIRVAGHCGCVPPEDPWVEYYDDDGVEVYSMEAKADYEKYLHNDSSLSELAKEGLRTHRFEEDRSPFRCIVPSYHVDSELGLYKLVEVIRTIL